MKLNWTKINATAKRIAAQKAELDIPPEVEPELKFYDVLNMYLAHKVTYFIPINAPHANGGNLRKVTHFATLRMAGKKLQHTRHEFTFWEAPDTTENVQHVLNTPPTFTLITKPFIFHSQEDAYAEVKRILNLHAQN